MAASRDVDSDFGADGYLKTWIKRQTANRPRPGVVEGFDIAVGQQALTCESVFVPNESWLKQHVNLLALLRVEMAAVEHTQGGEPIAATMMREVYILDEKESYDRFVKYFARESEVSIYLPYTEFGGESNLPKEITVTVESKG